MKDLGGVLKKALALEIQRSGSASENEGKVLNVMTKLKELIESNLTTVGAKSLWSILSENLKRALLAALRDRPTQDVSGIFTHCLLFIRFCIRLLDADFFFQMNYVPLMAEMIARTQTPIFVVSLFRNKFQWGT